MKEEIVSFETAVLAEKNGFNETCFNVYRNVDNALFLFEYGCDKTTVPDSATLAPSQSLLQRWLREDRLMHMYVDYDPYGQSYECMVFTTNQDKINHQLNAISDDVEQFETYEQALEFGLQKALKSL